jgi:hypothetical protein
VGPKSGGAAGRAAPRLVRASQHAHREVRAPTAARPGIAQSRGDAMSLLERTSCDGPPAASTDCSIRDGAATSPALATLLLQA